MTKLEIFKAHLVRARKSRATIKQYMSFAKSYARFCAGKSFDSPQDAVCSYLSSLSGKSVTHQKGALNALAGKNGLYAANDCPLGKLPGWVNAREIQTVPVWVTQAETEVIADHLTEPWEMMVLIMFGAGLRIGEVVSLRWRDIDFERMTITVRQGKGNKDRITFLPKILIEPLRLRSKRCRALWQEDRARSRPGVSVPRSFSNKSKKTGETWPFFWVFPAAGESCDPETKVIRRHHIHKKSPSKPIRKAVARAGIAKRVTCHSFRHGFATAYLLAGGNIRELADLLGHESIKTTEIYLHCLPTFTDRVGSPLDVRENVVSFAKFQPVSQASEKPLTKINNA